MRSLSSPSDHDCPRFEVGRGRDAAPASAVGPERGLRVDSAGSARTPEVCTSAGDHFVVGMPVSSAVCPGAAMPLGAAAMSILANTSGTGY